MRLWRAPSPAIIPRCEPALFQPHATRIVANGARPIGKDTEYAHLLGQHIQRHHQVAIIMQGVKRGLIVEGRIGRALGGQHFFDDATRAFECPGDNVEPRRLGVPGVLRRHDLAGRRVHRQQRPHRWRYDFDALRCIAAQFRSSRQLNNDIGIIQKHRLLAEIRIVVDPVEDVVFVKRLRPHFTW